MEYSDLWKDAFSSLFVLVSLRLLSDNCMTLLLYASSIQCVISDFSLVYVLVPIDYSCCETKKPVLRWNYDSLIPLELSNK